MFTFPAPCERLFTVCSPHHRRQVHVFTFPAPCERLFTVCSPHHRRQVHVFTFPAPCERLFTAETGDNPLGLCEVSPLATSDNHVLCFPARKRGALQLIDLTATEAEVSCAPVTINAHQGPLAALAVNQQGSLVSTD